jgi:hypothetical protein
LPAVRRRPARGSPPAPGESTPADESEQAISFAVGCFGSAVAVGFAGLTALFGDNWWPVLGVGWLGTVIGGLVAIALYSLFQRLVPRATDRQAERVGFVAIAIGCAVPVIMVLILWSFYS